MGDSLTRCPLTVAAGAATGLAVDHRQTSVRTCGFNLGDNMIFTTTDARMGNIAQLFTYDIRMNLSDRTWRTRFDRSGLGAPRAHSADARFSVPASAPPKNARPGLTETSDPVSVVDLAGSKVTSAAWGPLNKLIYAGHENGDVAAWDWQVRQTPHSSGSSPKATSGAAD